MVDKKRDLIKESCDYTDKNIIDELFDVKENNEIDEEEIDIESLDESFNSIFFPGSVKKNQSKVKK